MEVRAIKGDMKADVSSGGFLGEAVCESKRVRVASKGAHRGVST